jgi:hypothetical protein
MSERYVRLDERDDLDPDYVAAIKRVVADAVRDFPPFSEEQRARLAVLLTPPLSISDGAE